MMYRRGHSYLVTGGALHGVTIGSILAVYPAAGTRDQDRLLGHLRVTSADALTSQAERVTYGEKPTPAELPETARCRVVYRDYGDLKLTAQAARIINRATGASVQAGAPLGSGVSEVTYSVS